MGRTHRLRGGAGCTTNGAGLPADGGTTVGAWTPPEEDVPVAGVTHRAAASFAPPVSALGERLPARTAEARRPVRRQPPALRAHQVEHAGCLTALVRGSAHRRFDREAGAAAVDREVRQPVGPRLQRPPRGPGQPGDRRRGEVQGVAMRPYAGCRRPRGRRAARPGRPPGARPLRRPAGDGRGWRPTPFPARRDARGRRAHRGRMEASSSSSTASTCGVAFMPRSPGRSAHGPRGPGRSGSPPRSSWRTEGH